MLHIKKNSMNRLSETEPAVVKFCRFSLFLKDYHSRLYSVLLTFPEDLIDLLSDTMTKINARR